MECKIHNRQKVLLILNMFFQELKLAGLITAQQS